MLEITVQRLNCTNAAPNQNTHNALKLCHFSVEHDEYLASCHLTSHLNNQKSQDYCFPNKSVKIIDVMYLK